MLKRKKSGFRLVSLVTCGVFALATQAGAACYTKPQYEAEQALRLHTELMVLGLSCQKYMPQHNLFAGYQSFTTKHRKNLMAWESTLIKYFEGSKGNARANFDKFRTGLANELSQKAAQLTPPVYCNATAPLMETALKMSPDQFVQSVTRGSAFQTSTRPLCDQKTAASKPSKATGDSLVRVSSPVK